MLPEKKLRCGNDLEILEMTLQYFHADFHPKTLTGTLWKQAMVDTGKIEATEGMFQPCTMCGRKFGHKPECQINATN